MKTPIALAALALAVALTACSPEAEPEPRAVDPAGSPVTRPDAVPAAEGEVRTRGPVTVLDDGDGAELCLGGVAESLPPQCGGPRLIGWDWAEHPEHEDVSGVKWGDFAVTGTFDGTDVTPTEVVPQEDYDGPEPSDEEPLGTPCDEPAGGWQPADPAGATPEAMDETLRVASALPGYAMAWLDQSMSSSPQTNDPTQLVINVAVTQDPSGAESKLRETWGGALCVSEAEHSDRELQRISRDLLDLPGMLSGGGSSRPDHLEFTVIHDDGSFQAWVDQEHGEGLVEISSALVSAAD